MVFLPFLQGIGLGASMIIPIGAQNSFILNQAVKRNYHLQAASICVACEIVLVALGIFGGGQLISANDWLHTLITWGGIVFLAGYGGLSFKAALTTQTVDQQQAAKSKSLKAVVATALAVTLLNPHVYLDTVVILGSVGSQFVGDDKIAFTLGIILASILWFYSLSLAAARMSEILNRPRVRKGIDLAVGTIMWLIAASLCYAWVNG